MRRVMPETIACARCGSPLRLPEAFIGKEVRCPACQQTFTAQIPVEAPSPLAVRAEPRDERRDPAARYPDLRDDEEEEARLARRRRAYEEARRARERVQPHRGGTVLALGIVSICLCCIPQISLALGVAAVVMGSIDLARMRKGATDPAGRALTTAGLVCGILSPALTVIVLGSLIVLAQDR
jgi:uncharacterized Zn finger protein (UPF0148 family)